MMEYVQRKRGHASPPREYWIEKTEEGGEGGIGDSPRACQFCALGKGEKAWLGEELRV